APPVHGAVAALVAASGAISEDFLFQLLKSRQRRGAIPEPVSERLAWFAVNVALLHAIHTKAFRVSRFPAAFDWFFQNRRDVVAELVSTFGIEGLDEAHAKLSNAFIDSAMVDLLPYLLEPHGHVTRSELERNHHSIQKRHRKRQAGVFYTPSDVAEFMVRELVDDSQALTWLDPACGTAIFLREILRTRSVSIRQRYSALEFCQRFLYGVDISPLATESAVFVLLAHCAIEETVDRPFDAWRALAQNFAPCDATLLSTKTEASLFDGGALHLGELFPENSGGFDRIVMNPPYSAFTLNSLHVSLWESFRDLTPGTQGNLPVAFIEIMWKACKAGGAAAAVLPLSIAASSHMQFRACRRTISNSGGRWEFLFFDREPHA
ncbi:MAG: N-6 DNA methylase, partial [Terriglobia bacterium]